MVPYINWPRRVVRRDPGPGTCSGAGDVVTDNMGQTWRVVDCYEADMIRSGTAGSVATLHSDGTIT